MKSLTLPKTLSVLLIVFGFLSVQNAFPQTANKQKLTKIDQFIKIGFDSLKARKWVEAIGAFEEAEKILEKDKQPSEMLFTLFELPDEDNSVLPANAAEKQITDYRHSVATKQALLQFLSFAYQLNGNSAQAEKHHDAVYALQGPLWGMSWKLFAPRFYRVFDEQVKGEKGENFGRYQYLAATLLADAGDEFNLVFDILLSAQKNVPTDGDIAGLLANGFLQKKNPKEAERLAKLSLQLKPDQKAVLIDLATAQWLLNNFDDSIKHAEAAAVLDPQAPGPHLTLALNFIEKNNFPRALKESATAASLSRRHPFYLTVQAAAFEAAGNPEEAEKLLSEAWRQKLPSYEDLDKWYINEKLRRLVLKIAARIAAPKIKT